ncbi:MAG: hypothetical protein ACRED0_11470, partial [Gammaproteobacteria bacterium]
NIQRVTEELAKCLGQMSPDCTTAPVDIRHIALAVARNCVNADNVKTFAPPQALMKFYERFNIKTIDDPQTDTDERFNVLLDDTDTATKRQGLPLEKAKLEVQNLGDSKPPYGLIRVNEKGKDSEFTPTLDMITQAIAQRSLEGFKPDTHTDFMIDREADKGGYKEPNTQIALFRFFLEPMPMNVPVNKWSMNVSPFRGDTYTFADFVQDYIAAISTRLAKDLKRQGCEGLAEESHAQFLKVFPPPALSPFAIARSLALAVQAPDLAVDDLGCDRVSQALLEFRITNTGNEAAGRFLTSIVFVRTKDMQEVGRAEIPEPGLGAGDFTLVPVDVPRGCFPEDVPIEQRGCGVFIAVDSRGEIEEPDEGNNTFDNRFCAR